MKPVDLLLRYDQRELMARQVLPPAIPLRIARSLRFNSADSAYLNRVPGSSGSLTTWTFSAWVKRAAVGANHMLLHGNDTTAASFEGARLQINSSDVFAFDCIAGGGTICALQTTTALVDPTAWYHLVFGFDSTQATAADRMRMFINGVEQTSFSSRTDPALNATTQINSAISQDIGRDVTTNTGARSFFSGYLAYVDFIDGLQLSASAFGEIWNYTGEWKPRVYSGVYGGNGFHLDFSDNSAATATALGKDSSGNGNNWTPTNISITTGAGNDSLVDTPTNYGTDTGVGGEVRGNYVTLSNVDTISATATISNGMLDYSLPSGQTIYGTGVISQFPVRIEITSTAGTTHLFSIVPATSRSQAFTVGALGYGYYANNGQKYINGTASAYGASIAAGDVVAMEIDPINGTLEFFKQTGGAGAFASQGVISITPGDYKLAITSGGGSTDTGAVNFGQRPWNGTATAGFKALCTQNMTEGSITTSGTFTGNANVNGPVVWLNGTPVAMTINGNAVTFGTHVDRLSGGFKVISSSASYNISGSNTYSITSTGVKAKYAQAQINP